MTKTFIVSIGDELVKGEILNTNAQYIANSLVNMGFNISAILNLPDDYKQLVFNLRSLLSQKGVFIITGGLGGTRDDITRKALGEVLKKDLVLDKFADRELENWYRSKGREYTDSDRMQARVPEGGILLKNRVGLAYGIYIEINESHIFCLPGVPHEMKSMFDNDVVPMLRQKNLHDERYKCQILYFGDIAEYVLDKKINGIVSRYDGISYGTRASNGLIRVRFESFNGNLESCVNEVKEKLSGNYLYSGFRDISEVVGEILTGEKFTLSTAESCTAGYLAKRITDIPGSSNYFVGGVVAYSNIIKEQILGVSAETLKKYGAVGEQTAWEMASGALNIFNSTFSIAVTGIAGPGGGSKEKPVGTVYIGIGKKQRDGILDIEVQGFRFDGTREGIRERTVNVSLVMLLKKLKNMVMKSDPGLLR